MAGSSQVRRSPSPTASATAFTGAFVPIAGHITSTGPNPTIAVGAGAGTGATASVTGTDTAGLIQLDAGTDTVAGALFTVTFAATFGTPPKVVVLSPANPGAEASRPYLASTATTFTATSTVAIGASSSHYWFYLVVG